MKKLAIVVLFLIAIATSVNAHHLGYSPMDWSGNEERVHNGDEDMLPGDLAGFPDDVGNREMVIDRNLD